MNGCSWGSNNITATSLLLVPTPVRDFLFTFSLLLWYWILLLMIRNVVLLSEQIVLVPDGAVAVAVAIAAVDDDAVVPIASFVGVADHLYSF